MLNDIHTIHIRTHNTHRYRRQDEIGTHYALTVDFESLEDNCVTVRDGFTRSQVRVDIETVIERMSTPRHGMF